MNVTSGGFPFLIMGTQAKKASRNEKRDGGKAGRVNNINIVINNNTWVNQNH